MIHNVLAERYASNAIKSIWSAEGRIVLERELWIAVMTAQRELGVDIPETAIEAYRTVKDQINLQSIMDRERITRHDVKAVSYTHLRAPRDQRGSRMPSSA